MCGQLLEDEFIDGPPMIIRPPISECPLCGYTLEPPHSAGRCPECGTRIDPDMVVFHPVKTGRRLKRGIFVFVVGIHLLCPIMGILGQFVTSLGSSTFMAILVIAALCALIDYAWTGRGRHKALIVSLDGLLIIRDAKTVRIGYDYIRKIERYDMTPTLTLAGDKRPFQLFGFFDSNEEWFACADILDARRSGTTADVDAVLTARIGPSTGREAAPAKRGDWHPLQLIGITAVVLGFLLSSVAEHVFSPPIVRPIQAVMFIAVYTGIILLLVGLWKSDKMK